MLSERFSMASTSQYYASLPEISRILKSIENSFCASKTGTCRDVIDALTSTDYLDIDYDTITQALVVTAGWSSISNDQGVTRREGDGTVEIGVLMHEPNPDPEDIQFGGFLTVLGQDAAPSKPTIHTHYNPHS